jgi:hypothetical protein
MAMNAKAFMGLQLRGQLRNRFLAPVFPFNHRMLKHPMNRESDANLIFFVKLAT